MTKREKMTVLRSCQSCHWQWIDGNLHGCDVPGCGDRLITDEGWRDYDIPDWCPLPDVKTPDEDEAEDARELHGLGTQLMDMGLILIRRARELHPTIDEDIAADVALLRGET